jgi:membrane-associated phospholipid phosphatase
VQFIDRQRPEVHRLEALGQGASFPSGHTAAAVALYGGLAMIAVALGARISVRWLAIVVAVLAPLVVGISRMYRGMHHPLDVVLGAAVGVGCLAVGTFVAWVFVRSHASARTAHEVRGS